MWITKPRFIMVTMLGFVVRIHHTWVWLQPISTEVCLSNMSSFDAITLTQTKPTIRSGTPP